MEEDGSEEEPENMFLQIDEDGKATIHKPEDYVEMHKDEAEIVKAFIDAHKEEFKKFCDELAKEQKEVR